jgi:drug/metabolite transporter (DMT)-like permease
VTARRTVRPLPPLVRILVLGSIWGSSFLWIKLALDGLPPLDVALGRCLVGAVTMWTLVAVRHHRIPRDRTLWAHLVFVGFASCAVPFALFAWAELHVDSGVAGVYNATTPLFTLLVALAVLRSEKATAARVGGLLLGMAGVVVVLGPWNGTGTNSLLGQLACLAAAAAYGVAINYVRRYVSPRGLDTAVQTGMQLTAASVMLAIAAPFGGGHVHLHPKVVLAVTVLGALGTGIAYVVFNSLIRDVGATSASLVTFVVPVVAVALGAVALGEPVTWNLFAGAAVVIVGVALAEGRLRAPSRALRSAGAAGTPPAPPRPSPR